MKRNIMTVALVGIAAVFVGLLATRAGLGLDQSDPAATPQRQPASEPAAADNETDVRHDDQAAEAIDWARLTPEQWKQRLTPEQLDVMREEGTERAYSGAYWNTETPGVYRCAACGQLLFSSSAKFHSGTGWPSFYQPIAPSAVVEKTDRSFFMERTEVRCSRCGSHLGHVFDDGPKPTGLRYCINSVALELDPAPGAAPAADSGAD